MNSSDSPNNSLNKSDAERRLLVKEDNIINVDVNNAKNRSFAAERNWLKRLKDNLLLLLTFIGVVFGTGIGFLLRGLNLSADKIELIQFPGDVFMNLLKMLIVPLLISSVISGISQMESKSFDKIGIRTVAYFMCTTIIAVILGITLAVTIKPGKFYLKSDHLQSVSEQYEYVENQHERVGTTDAILDLIRNIFPENLFQAAFESAKTVKSNVSYLHFSKNLGGSQDVPETRYHILKKLTYTNNPNILGIITVSIAFGIIMQKLGKSTKILVDVFISLNDVIMKIISIIMWYSPLGIMSLLIAKILTIDDLKTIMSRLGMFMLTVVSGVLIHSLIILPFIYFLITRKNPFVFARNMNQALLTAFGTASSAATLPITMKCVETKNNVDTRVSRFVLPLGATVNMDGTALYEAVVALFIAQINNIYLNFGSIITISLTATLSSIGAASIPSAGLFTIFIVLTSVNLPINDITLIMAVDWLLDRFRTATNVLGDSLGAGIIDHLSKGDLNNDDNNENIEASINPASKTYPINESLHHL
ncbi:unnamed protein product [Gordionus sp. m RMFG-2023]|uniref:excitatory amino acid transporter-like isoform X2 n=1 Tax=Gordionus sp. m RMFG-2023 TaxID=3053472 RepID=UPI0030E28A00